MDSFNTPRKVVVNLLFNRDSDNLGYTHCISEFTRMAGYMDMKSLKYSSTSLIRTAPYNEHQKSLVTRANCFSWLSEKRFTYPTIH